MFNNTSPGFVNYKKGWTRIVTTSDKAYHLLAHDKWFPPATPASSTTKTGRHDIAEILLKVALRHQKSINDQLKQLTMFVCQTNNWLPSNTKHALYYPHGRVRSVYDDEWFFKMKMNDLDYVHVHLVIILTMIGPMILA